MKAIDVYEQIAREKVIAIVRRESGQEVSAVCRALVAGGLHVMELPLTMERAHRRLEAVADALPEALLGAGSVLDAESARIAILSGAKFLVTPAFDADVVKMGNRYGVPVFPGVHSPTEAVRALECGCMAVKLFPASEFTPAAIGAWKTPFHNLELIPTGGVGEQNAAQWLRAGAFALGVGGALCSGTEEEVRAKAARLKTIAGEA